MNEKDQAAVKKLRNALEDYITPEFTDYDLLRWLQGYDFQHTAVVPRLKHHFRFLRCFDFRHMSQHPMMLKYFPYGLCGPTGKDNNLVYIDCIGSLHVDIMKCLNGTSIVKSYINSNERVLDKIRERELATGQQSGLVYVVDLEHMVFDEKQFQLITGPFRCLVGFFFVHYAELIKKIIVVNGPDIIYYVFQLMRPFFPAQTRQKILVLGSNWKIEILNHISPENLPKHWGGHLTDHVTGDKWCSSFIHIPPLKVEPSDFWVPSPVLLADLTGTVVTGTETETDTDFFRSKDGKIMATKFLRKLTVPAWRFEFLTVKVSEPGQILSWIFTASGDYGFGIFFTATSETSAEQETTASMETDEMEMVYPYVERMSGPTSTPEYDEIVCRKAGYYKMKFSNAFSWMHSLKILYHVKIKDRKRSPEGV